MKEKMKDSGIPWIGQIPEDWKVAKLKNFTKFYSGGTPNVSNQFNYNDNGVSFVTIKDMSNNYLINKTEKHITKLGIKEKNLKILDKGTVLYSIYATVGEISELNINATINQAILALTNLKNINKTFLKYNLLSMKDFVISLSNGNTQFNLNTEIVKNFYLTTPSFELQQKIVEILDKKCGQIDELVRIEENEIEKLKEYKTSLITKVVTKGLDPNAKMKDSGIPWIGQIPEDWKVGRLKNFYDVWGGTTPSTENIGFWNGNIKWATPIDFKENYIYDTLKKITKLAIEKNNLKVAHENTLILTTRAPIGKIAITKAEMTCNQGCKILFSKNKVFYRYTYYYLLAFCNILNVLGTGTTFLEISSTNLSNFNHLFLRLEIQQQIVEYLDKRCEEIDNLIKIKQEKIEKLKEYKKSLIYQYVTGKKEV